MDRKRVTVFKLYNPCSLAAKVAMDQLVFYSRLNEAAIVSKSTTNSIYKYLSYTRVAAQSIQGIYDSLVFPTHLSIIAADCANKLGVESFVLFILNTIATEPEWIISALYSVPSYSIYSSSCDILALANSDLLGLQFFLYFWHPPLQLCIHIADHNVCH